MRASCSGLSPVELRVRLLCREGGDFIMMRKAQIFSAPKTFKVAADGGDRC